MKKNKFALISLLIFLLFSFNCYAQAPKYVRVAIIQDAESLNFKISGSYEITDAIGKKVLARGRSLNTTITSCKEGILVGPSNLAAGRVFIKTYNPDLVMIDGRTYRGNIELIKNKDKKITVVNYIGLEDYVKGISVREISHYWPPNALKAAVIVFRSFAVYKIEESAGKDYDLTSDIYSQVYSGMAAERYRINKAVDETKGLILVYQGKVFPAFYHATCAGHTEDASRLWNINIAPLAGVPCGFCKESPHFNWHYVLSLKEINDKLEKAGFKINNIKDILISGRDESGRITDLKILSAEKELKISAKDFRETIGPNIIKSTNFDLSIAGQDVVFEGLGWGHGVGLCQWGSYFMAKQGYNYEQILEYYYPGALISQLD
ncbi:MAG: SpoIID/LytB domain-containing protein [Candidatus Omnitrophica bacterium]|nr:SpoIID/LytB domain-containing protein [Candidatus Omnitrophota bacterium]